MSSPIRTALGGIGVIAICIALASLKGHHLLMAFAAASLLAAVWSWARQKVRPLPDKIAAPEESQRNRSRRNRNGATIYQFPAQQLNVSDASS